MQTELDVLKEIRKGKSLNEFEEVTPLMALAAMDSRNAWSELPENVKNRRFAKMAVDKDFRALKDVPSEIINACALSFATWGHKIRKEDLNDFMSLLNGQDDVFRVEFYSKISSPSSHR